MSDAELELIKAEAEAAAAAEKLRVLRERLAGRPVAASTPVVARKPGKRGPSLPKALTPEEKAKAADVDEAAWAKYERRHGVRRTG